MVFTWSIGLLSVSPWMLQTSGYIIGYCAWKCRKRDIIHCLFLQHIICLSTKYYVLKKIDTEKSYLKLFWEVVGQLLQLFLLLRGISGNLVQQLQRSCQGDLAACHQNGTGHSWHRAAIASNRTSCVRRAKSIAARLGHNSWLFQSGRHFGSIWDTHKQGRKHGCPPTTINLLDLSVFSLIISLGKESLSLCHFHCDYNLCISAQHPPPLPTHPPLTLSLFCTLTLLLSSLLAVFHSPLPSLIRP